MKCALCLAERPSIDMARLYVSGKGYFPLCHGPVDTKPTCYEKYQFGRVNMGRGELPVLQDRGEVPDGSLP